MEGEDLCIEGEKGDTMFVLIQVHEVADRVGKRPVSASGKGTLNVFVKIDAISLAYFRTAACRDCHLLWWRHRGKEQEGERAAQGECDRRDRGASAGKEYTHCKKTGLSRGMSASPLVSGGVGARKPSNCHPHSKDGGAPIMPVFAFGPAGPWLHPLGGGGLFGSDPPSAHPDEVFLTLLS